MRTRGGGAGPQPEHGGVANQLSSTPLDCVRTAARDGVHETMNEMHWRRFEKWLNTVKELDARTIGSRIRNCKRVERFEGDLQSQFDTDGLSSLMERLTYSTEDARCRREPKHSVPINGDVRTGTATLKAAVGLYRDYRKSNNVGFGVDIQGQPTRRQASRRQTATRHWPDWPQPSEETLLEFARALAPLVRFIEPDIVAAVAEDNRRFRTEWSLRFREYGIDPEIYVWKGSPCAFPGVRRHAGSKEISAFRRQSTPDNLPPQCLAIDDNDHPKHLWAFVFTGKPFRKKGPDGYQLGHLMDHKDYGNRWREELNIIDGAYEPSPLFGLFTSAAKRSVLPICAAQTDRFLVPAPIAHSETCAATVRRRMPNPSASSGREAMR